MGDLFNLARQFFDIPVQREEEEIKGDNKLVMTEFGTFVIAGEKARKRARATDGLVKSRWSVGEDWKNHAADLVEHAHNPFYGEVETLLSSAVGLEANMSFMGHENFLLNMNSLKNLTYLSLTFAYTSAEDIVSEGLEYCILELPHLKAVAVTPSYAWNTEEEGHSKKYHQTVFGWIRGVSRGLMEKSKVVSFYVEPICFDKTWHNDVDSWASELVATSECLPWHYFELKADGHFYAVFNITQIKNLVIPACCPMSTDYGGETCYVEYLQVLDIARPNWCERLIVNEPVLSVNTTLDDHRETEESSADFHGNRLMVLHPMMSTVKRLARVHSWVTFPENCTVEVLDKHDLTVDSLMDEKQVCVRMDGVSTREVNKYVERVFKQKAALVAFKSWVYFTVKFREANIGNRMFDSLDDHNSSIIARTISGLCEFRTPEEKRRSVYTDYTTAMFFRHTLAYPLDAPRLPWTKSAYKGYGWLDVIEIRHWLSMLRLAFVCFLCCVLILILVSLTLSSRASKKRKFARISVSNA